MPTQEDISADLVAQLYRERRPAWEDAEQQVNSWLKRQCDDLLKDEVDSSRLSPGHSRIKDEKRALDKARRQLAEDSAELDGCETLERLLTDIVGVKVLCKSSRDQRLLFRAVQERERLDRWRVVRAKDYVKNVKASGYRACHVLLEIPVTAQRPVTVEIQIKTRLQDAWGELTHEDLYKPEGPKRSGQFHESVARAMASMLAEVDRLADDLAEELERDAHGNGEKAGPGFDESCRMVTVRTTGPRYALAVDAHGVQGLIPAYAVRRLVGAGDLIAVSDFVHVGDQLPVEVQDDEDGTHYFPQKVLHAVDGA